MAQSGGLFVKTVPKIGSKTKLVGIVQVSCEHGFRIRIMPTVKDSIEHVDDEIKVEFVRLILNNIEANLMLDFGLAEVENPPEDTKE